MRCRVHVMLSTSDSLLSASYTGTGQCISYPSIGIITFLNRIELCCVGRLHFYLTHFEL